MTKIYIVRHAEAEGNLYRRIHGHYDSVITDMGMEQSAALQNRFKDIHIDAVYSSDLIRTQTTAKAIYAPKGLELTTTKNLREICLGVWEDRAWGDVAYEDPDALNKFGNDPYNWRIDGGERYSDVLDRALATLMELAKCHNGETIAVVTHGCVIRALMAYALEKSRSETSEVNYCDNTAVGLLHVENGKIDVQFMNDNSHLPKEISFFRKKGFEGSAGDLNAANLRFVPMDLKRHEKRYLEYRQDAWMSAHGSMDGYADGYLDLSRQYAQKHPSAVMEAFWGDTPGGLIEMSPDMQDNSGRITFFYMRQPFRGKGLAVQLLGQAVSFYRPMGCEKLALHVAAENRPAVSFYQKYGFIKKGEAEGAVGTLNVMEKDIAVKIR